MRNGKKNKRRINQNTKSWENEDKVKSCRLEIHIRSCSRKGWLSISVLQFEIIHEEH